MLMTPDHEVKKVGQHLLVNTTLSRTPTEISLVAILVYKQDTEVLSHGLRRYESDFIVRKDAMHSLIPNMSNAVQGNFRQSLLKTDGMHLDVI